MIEKIQELHSINISCVDGKIHVRRDTVVRDTDTGEEFARVPWRCPIAPGDTAKATALLGDFAPEATALAGKALGGWTKLEQDRAAAIELSKEAEIGDSNKG